MISIAARIQLVPASQTLAITAKARELKEAGKDVISFSAGEPDFTTPDVVNQAAIRAIQEGHTHYTPVGGTTELKASIANYYKKRTGIDFPPAEIAVSAGAKHALYNLFMTIIDDGDEVIIPAPYWVSYPVMVNMAGGKAVAVTGEADNNFVPTVEALEAARTDKTRAIILNNPTNPTGAFWDRSQLEGIAQWLKQHPEIVVISDAIYSELTYDNLEYTELLNIAPELRDRYVIIDGISKAFAMTGWRLGYTLAPKHVIAAMMKIQSQSTSNPCSITQAAAIEALDQGRNVIDPMHKAFEARRNLICDLLNAIPGIKLNRPRGAFYAFPDVTAFLGKSYNGKVIETDTDLASYLIEEASVAVVPGTAFGAPGFIRMSYADKEENLKEGVRRIADALNKLS